MVSNVINATKYQIFPCTDHAGVLLSNFVDESFKRLKDIQICTGLNTFIYLCLLRHCHYCY